MEGFFYVFNEINMLKELAHSIVKNQCPAFELDKNLLERWILDLYDLLFSAKIKDEEILTQRLVDSQLIFNSLVEKIDRPSDVLSSISRQFYERLEIIFETLLMDLDEFLASDPAASDKTEILLSYPGFYAIYIYRISHEISKLGLPILARVISEIGHRDTGIDIHPNAKIGSHFFIDHGTGIVIGQTAELGNHVKIYQGVTLGALQVDRSYQFKKRHPTIGDQVTLYANCTILGGETNIGKGSVIGGNVWLTKSVPTNSIVYHNPEVKVKSLDNSMKDYFDFVI